MPYRLKKFGDGWKVVSPDHPDGFSKEPMSKEKAKKQQAALYVNTKDENFDRRLDAALGLLQE